MLLRLFPSISLLASVLATLCAQPLAFGNGQTLALKPKVAFVPTDITINGVARPDIGRALADALCAGALKRGSYRVYNVESTRSVNRNKLRKKQQDGIALGSMPLTLPSESPGGLPSALDYLISFNLVGDGDRYQFVLKKVRAIDQEVIEAHELSTTGRLDKVFGLVPQALDRLADSNRSPVFPRTQSPAEIRAAEPVVPHIIVPPAPMATRPGTWSGLPLEYVDVDFTKVPKALIYRRVGSIEATNEPWRFAIIRPISRSGFFLNDSLHVLWDDTGGVYASLKVANFDSGKVIADFGGITPSHHPLFSGDAVYGWAPPLY
jgi:hypothetical protein